MEVTHQQSSDSHAVVGGGAAKKYRITNSGAIISMLSDTIYSNKPLAMVREVICNGWDSHIKCGITDKALEITLTDTFVSFEDFGSGIPKDIIEDVYCVYGDSTKVKDETQTGGLGLGSKAPFAYTSHFTVENSINGIKTIYAATKGSVETDGENDFREMGWMPCAQSGMKVIVPLKSKSEVSLIRSLITTIVSNGEMNANLNGAQIAKRIDLSEEKKIGFMLNTLRNNFELTSEISVQYGAIIYPVDQHNEALKDAIDEFHKIVPASINTKTLLFAPPSSIGVAPSRESLSYSDVTINTINRLLLNAVRRLKNERVNAKKAVINSLLERTPTLENLKNSGHISFDNRGHYSSSVLSMAVTCMFASVDHEEMGRAAIYGLMRKFPTYRSFLRRLLPKISDLDFRNRERFGDIRALHFISDKVAWETNRRASRKLIKFLVDFGIKDLVSVRDRYQFAITTLRNMHVNTVAEIDMSHMVIGVSAASLDKCIAQMVDDAIIDADDRILCIRVAKSKTKLKKALTEYAAKHRIKLTVADEYKPPKREVQASFYKIGDLNYDTRDRFHTNGKEFSAMSGKYLMPVTISGNEILVREPYRFKRMSLVEELYPDTIMVNAQATRDRMVKEGSKDIVDAMIEELTPMMNNTQLLYNVFSLQSEAIVRRNNPHDYNFNHYALSKMFEESIKFAKLIAPVKFKETEAGDRAVDIFKCLVSLSGRNSVATDFRTKLVAEAKRKFAHLTIKENEFKQRFQGVDLLLRGVENTNTNRYLNFDHVYAFMKMAKDLGTKMAKEKQSEPELEKTDE